MLLFLPVRPSLGSALRCNGSVWRVNAAVSASLKNEKKMERRIFFTRHFELPSAFYKHVSASPTCLPMLDEGWRGWGD